MKFVGYVFLLLPMLSGLALAQSSDVVPGEYIVKFKRGLSTSQASGKILGKAEMKGVLGRGQMFHVKAGPSMSIDELRNDPDVEFVEPNYIIRRQEEPAGVMLQTMSLEQLESVNIMAGDCPTGVTTNCYRQTGTRNHATEAWSAALPYSAINRPIVAIIDTGLDYTHYVFTQSGAIWLNPGEVSSNNADDDLNGYRDDVSGWNFINNTPSYYDDEGHGTHVAGIVLGATMDILGTQPLPSAKIRIMALKFLDASGSGTTANAVNAMYYAVNNGAKVINNSWGGGSYSRSLHDAFAYAYSHGVLIVDAAGNYSKNNDSVAMYPANYDTPSNISVAAIYDSGSIASFSNFGPTLVHIGASGSLVYSTVPGGLFGLMSGTSMAAPLVSGAAALAWREATQLSGYQIKNLVLQSSVAVTNLSGKVSTGGRLDILELLTDAQLAHFTAASQPSYSPQYKAESYISSSGEGAKAATGCGLVRAVITGEGESGYGNGWMTLFLLLPIMLWFGLKQMNSDPASNRKFDRFRMQSNIKVKIGERELVGEMNTISVGGLSFNVDEALQKGGLVTMRIASPDGKDVVEVEGRIVWNELNHSYGVQFANANQSVVEKISNWTSKLSKSAA